MDEEEREIFFGEISAWDLPTLKANSENSGRFNAAKIAIMKTAIHRLESEAEKKKAQSNTLQSLWKDAGTARGSLVRLLIFGNAGGAIATLSLIGTIVSKTTASTFDRQMFYVLAIFVAGLVGGWVMRMAEMNIADARLYGLRADTKEEALENKRERDRWEAILQKTIIACIATLGVGFMMGLSRLWQMTI